MGLPRSHLCLHRCLQLPCPWALSGVHPLLTLLPLRHPLGPPLRHQALLRHLLQGRGLWAWCSCLPWGTVFQRLHGGG
jgi:hypothetical protein